MLSHADSRDGAQDYAAMLFGYFLLQINNGTNTRCIYIYIYIYIFIYQALPSVPLQSSSNW